MGACKHIAALLYGIVDITVKKRTGKNAPTSRACGWIKPRSRNLSPKTAQDMNFKKVRQKNIPVLKLLTVSVIKV